MNAIIRPAAVLIALSIIGGTARSQENKSRDSQSSDEKTIVIRPKAESKEKYTIVVDGEKVTINGKPVDEFKSKDVDITRGKEGDGFSGDPSYEFRAPDASMFRGGWNMMRDNPFPAANKALLGVKTKKSATGALVEEVTSESAAEKAGLKKGDIITKIDDKEIADAESLFKAVSKYSPGDKISISYLREEKEYKTSATLTKNTSPELQPGHRNFDFRMLPEGSPDLRKFYQESNSKPRLGLQIQDLENNNGVKVLEVNAGTPADKAGLAKDDIITSANGTRVNNIEELKKVIRDTDKNDTIKLSYQRNNKTMKAEIRFPKKLNISDL